MSTRTYRAGMAGLWSLLLLGPALFMGCEHGCCCPGSDGPAPSAGPCHDSHPALTVTQGNVGVGPYGGQKRCPVTGDELDPAGTAVPVTVKGQTIYVCCHSCELKVKRDPDRYLAQVAVERTESTAARP